jgi:hypothetical protein
MYSARCRLISGVAVLTLHSSYFTTSLLVVFIITFTVSIKLFRVLLLLLITVRHLQNEHLSLIRCLNLILSRDFRIKSLKRV